MTEKNKKILFYINILFVLLIKSIASLFSILNLFSTEQIQYFFYISSLSQIFFFCISLGHTSDKDFTFFSRKQILYIILRLTVLTAGLLIYDQSVTYYLVPSIFFALLMTFNSFVDFRVKLYTLYIESTASFLLIISITFIIVISSLTITEGRMIIQILPFFIYTLLIMFTHISNRKIWFADRRSEITIDKFIFFYALLTSLYTFLDRRYIAEFGEIHQESIFIIINSFSLIVFFMDYYFKRMNCSNICFTSAILIYNVLAISFIFIGYEIEAFYTSILFFQFLCFSFYAIRKKKSIIISLFIFFIIICILLTLGSNKIINFFYVYYIMYLSQLVFSIYFIVNVIPRTPKVVA